MNSMIQKVKIIELNVNSIKSKYKQHCLESFIEQYQPDAMLLVETKLTKTLKFNIKDYKIYRDDCEINSGGGTAIMIKQNFQAEHINIQTFSSFEQTTVKVYLNNNNAIFLTSIYKPPDKRLKTNELNLLIDKYNKKQFIIGGDLNCTHMYWGNAMNKPEGTKLYKWLVDSIDRHKIIAPITDSPTCVRKNSESFIDLFLVEECININYSSTTQKLTTIDFDSDHRAVVLEITLQDKVVCSEPKRVYDWNKANYKKIRKYIDSKLDEVYLPVSRNLENDQIDAAVTKINEITQ